MASDLDGATNPPEPNTQAATPGEFAAVWNSLDEEQRAGWLRAMRAASDRAVLCKLRHEPQRYSGVDKLVRDTQERDVVQRMVQQVIDEGVADGSLRHRRTGT
jgi:hypothetical protein